MVTARNEYREDMVFHASLKGYLAGFFLSVVLTAIPFGLVMAKVLPPATARLLLVGFAAVQVIVHMVCFLHLNARTGGGWKVLATLFTMVVVVILLAGSSWVMYHMNTNMMPADPRAMRNMP
jgi:cytochrome o ubiquinol oxidase operon protein cyoD